MRSSTILKILPASLVLSAAANAQSITPLYGATAGTVSDVAVATTVPLPGDRAGDVAAAVVNGKGELEVIAWQDTTSKLVRLGSATVAGTTGSVAITGLDATRVVTASYDSANFTVAVNTWSVGTSDAGVQRQNGDSSAPAFIGGSIGIARLSSTRVAVSFVDPSSSDLFVYAYDISASGVPTQIAAWGVASVADSALGSLGIASINSNLVMTAVRDLSGNLKVITWQITSSAVNPMETYTAGQVKKVAIGAEFGTGNAITASVNGSGDLENIYWTISSSGKITRDQSATAGHASATAAAWLPNDFRITAVSGGSADLDTEMWENPWKFLSESSNGEEAHYDTSSAITQVAITGEGSTPEKDDSLSDYFVTGARSTAGDLQVQVWKASVNVSPPPK
jgi:hypothetical protein